MRYVGVQVPYYVAKRVSGTPRRVNSPCRDVLVRWSIFPRYLHSAYHSSTLPGLFSQVTNHNITAVIAARKRVQKVRLGHWDGHRRWVCCLCWAWQGMAGRSDTPRRRRRSGTGNFTVAGGYPGGLREQHGRHGRAFASLPGPCRPLGRRLRSRSSDTWMPRDDGTTSISGFPQPVKLWHMVYLDPVR